MIRNILLLLAIGCYSTHGFVAYLNQNGNPLKWSLANPSGFVHTNVVNRQTRAVRYWIGANAYSSENRAAELNAVRACFGQWESLPGTTLRMEEGGLLPGKVDINVSDHTNAVFWVRDNTLVNGERDDIRGLRGLTVVAFNAENTLLEADIVLNGFEFGWLTDLEDQVTYQPFVEASLLHEIGHFIGLDHSPVGGATLALGGLGLSAELGLSSDETAAARYLYPPDSNQQATLSGRVTMNGNPVFGAMIIVESEAGNVVSGTVSAPTGAYRSPAIPPGRYLVRATPFDPADVDDRFALIRGTDIAFDYENVDTRFLPSADHSVLLSANNPAQLDISVTAGEPAFRISAISMPNDLEEVVTANRWAATIRPGQSDLYVGVVSPSLPTGGATLTVTGDGLVLGDPIFKPNRLDGGRHAILVPIRVLASATPGLRSLVVHRGADVAYANGYLEVLPTIPDFNFDGLDDRFQRRFFPVFTAPDAAPDADPDGDGFDNRHEHATDSDPTDPLSVKFRIESVTLTAKGTLVRWQSGIGKRYQVERRSTVAGSAWEPVGAPVTAQASTTEFTDSGSRLEVQFYRIETIQ